MFCFHFNLHSHYAVTIMVHSLKFVNDWLRVGIDIVNQPLVVHEGRFFLGLYNLLVISTILVDGSVIGIPESFH